jgi:hypothetical protein
MNFTSALDYAIRKSKKYRRSVNDGPNQVLVHADYVNFLGENTNAIQIRQEFFSTIQ